MAKISIFTPTFNRGYIIENLYRSLQRQSNFDFEWLVINDGSADHTDDLFQKWVLEDNQFSIRYFKQENLGLMITLNEGVKLAKGKYLAKIDSDDYLTDDCIELLNNSLESIKEEKYIYAVGGMRGTEDGNPIKGADKWPLIDKNIGHLDIYDYDRDKYNLDADMTEAWEVEVLRKYPFPVFEGEKFAPEAIVFNDIALDGYKIRWFPKIICVCEYQKDGLTKNGDALQKNNPLGFSMAWKYKVKENIPFKSKIFYLVQSGALAIYSGKLGYIWDDNENKLLSTLLFPASFYVYLRRKKQFRDL